ncbi:MAG: hypothetical protein DMG06_07870 [Acidobacteria bacterium]|nr:MAG: hypothetical protein DMG06_07870 [Acidobacteriota bacterium]
MPWKEVSVMSLRWEFVELASQSNVNITRLCQRFGISRCENPCMPNWPGTHRGEFVYPGSLTEMWPAIQT